MLTPDRKTYEKQALIKKSHQRAKSQLSNLKLGLEQAIKSHMNNRSKSKTQANEIRNQDNLPILVKKLRHSHFTLPQNSYVISFSNYRNCQSLLPRTRIKSSIEQCRQQTRNYITQFNKQKQQWIKSIATFTHHKYSLSKLQYFTNGQQNLQHSTLDDSHFNKDIEKQKEEQKSKRNKKEMLNLSSQNLVIQNLPFIQGAKINTKKSSDQIKEIKQYLKQLQPKRIIALKKKDKLVKIAPSSFPLKSTRQQGYSPWQSHKTRFLGQQN